MAKRKRRRKTLAPTDGAPKKKKVVKYDGGMPVPNHGIPPFVSEKPGASEFLSQKFPLLALKKPETAERAQAKGLAFFDDVYKMVNYPDCSDRESATGLQYMPPTWMDPEVFVRMALEQPAVVAAARKASKGENKAANRSAVRDQLEEVFGIHYLKYMFEQFTEVQDLIAQYVVSHVHDEDQHSPPKKKKRRKKKKKAELDEAAS